MVVSAEVFWRDERRRNMKRDRGWGLEKGRRGVSGAEVSTVMGGGTGLEREVLPNAACRKLRVKRNP